MRASFVGVTSKLHHWGNVLSLRVFLALNDNEFDSLSFFKAPVTFARDGTVVNKDIFAFILLDKASKIGILACPENQCQRAQFSDKNPFLQ